MDTQATNSLISYLPYITLALSVLSLVLIVVLFNKLADVSQRLSLLNSTQRADRVPAKPEAGFDYTRVLALEKTVQELGEKIKSLTAIPEHVKTPEPIKEPVAAAVEEPVVEKTAEAPPVVDKDLKYFSKFPDQDQGFTDSSLMSKQNGEQVYELILTPDQGVGTFYISESSDVQKYALSDINFYLPKACQFMNQPGKHTGIKTVLAGTLIKSGDIWLIEEKVQIEFV